MTETRLSTRPTALAITLMLLACSAALPVAVNAQAGESMTLRFEANVMVATGSPGGPRSTMLEIRINEWTTDEERFMVLGEIQESTSDRPRNRNRAVARALRGASRVGSMNLRARHSWPIRFSREFPKKNGGRRILLATDRPVTFEEAFGNTMAGDFDVTVIELVLDADGNGTGTLSVGTTVEWSTETEKLEVTNFSSQPIRLENVRQVR